MNKEIENKTKLNFVEKIAVKRLIKKAKKYINNRHEYVENEKKYRDNLESQMFGLTDILEIETDEGEQLTKEYLKEMTTKELEIFFNEALEEVRKLL